MVECPECGQWRITDVHGIAPHVLVNVPRPGRFTWCPGGHTAYTVTAVEVAR